MDETIEQKYALQNAGGIDPRSAMNSPSAPATGGYESWLAPMREQLSGAMQTMTPQTGGIDPAPPKTAAATSSYGTPDPWMAEILAARGLTYEQWAAQNAAARAADDHTNDAPPAPNNNFAYQQAGNGFAPAPPGWRPSTGTAPTPAPTPGQMPGTGGLDPGPGGENPFRNGGPIYQPREPYFEPPPDPYKPYRPIYRNPGTTNPGGYRPPQIPSGPLTQIHQPVPLSQLNQPLPTQGWDWQNQTISDYLSNAANMRRRG